MGAILSEKTVKPWGSHRVTTEQHTTDAWKGNSLCTRHLRFSSNSLWCACWRITGYGRRWHKFASSVSHVPCSCRTNYVAAPTAKGYNCLYNSFLIVIHHDIIERTFVIEAHVWSRDETQFFRKRGTMHREKKKKKSRCNVMKRSSCRSVVLPYQSAGDLPPR